MLKLTNKKISNTTQKHLAVEQLKINSSSNKHVEAESLWKNKLSSRTKKSAFTEIKSKLKDMSVSVEICNYCEQSEATDIEHVLPKGVFPEFTFVWKNYILACKTCNSQYKLDKIAIFSPAGSHLSVIIKSNATPPSREIAFINPRQENPMDFMQLNFDDGQFYAKVPHIWGTQGFEKVEQTLAILALNDRSGLVRYRKTALGNYKRLITEYCNVKQAHNHQALADAVVGDPEINFKKKFETEKNRVLKGLKKSILEGEHPTVLREMILQKNRFLEPLKSNLSIISTDFHI